MLVENRVSHPLSAHKSESDDANNAKDGSIRAIFLFFVGRRDTVGVVRGAEGIPQREEDFSATIMVLRNPPATSVTSFEYVALTGRCSLINSMTS